MNNKPTLPIEDEPLLQEKCGILAIFNKTYTANLPLALLAAGGVQHRGQQGAGIALQYKKNIKQFTGNGLLRDVFIPSVVKRLNKPSKWMLVHCRYGTHGGYDKRNLQPCMITSKEGEKIAIIHNGEFVATEEIKKKISKKFPADISDTYLFAQLLGETEGLTWEHRVIHALSQVNGAYSLMIGIKNKLFIARDAQGIRPLVIGQLKNRWIVASETHALDKIGAYIIREVKRGEITCIDSKGLTIIKHGEKTKTSHFCDFEWAYFGRPETLVPTNEKEEDSKHPENWLAISSFRERCGAAIAREFAIKNATFAFGMPDSGMAVAMGYANALRIPYRQVIIRDHFDPNGAQRLFMRDDQKKRIGKKVLGKLSLIPDRKIWQDAIVVIGDDSIVRGNVTKRITKAVFAMGAKEVHWIIGYPPVAHPCHLGVSIRTTAELIAAQNDSDPVKIAKKINATSVHYITPEGFIQARLLNSDIKKTTDPKDIFLHNVGCGGCVTGKYPVSKEGEVYEPNLATGSNGISNGIDKKIHYPDSSIKIPISI